MKQCTGNKITIYQIYFRPEQRKGLAPEFVPYFKSEEKEREWREYWSFKENSAKALKSKGLTGYVSWKFESKSCVAAAKFIRFIENNPGYDVYFLNPFPIDALLFDNVWLHAEHYHPGILEFSEKLLKTLGYSIDIRRMRNSIEQVAFSNYWVGNAKFWRLYMQFTAPIEQYIRNNLTADESKFVYSIADKVSNCSHIPFIIERLFTTLLVARPDIRYLSYQYDSDDLKNRYSTHNRICYRLLRSEKIRQSIIGKALIRWILFLRKIFPKTI